MYQVDMGNTPVLENAYIQKRLLQ